MRIGVLIINEEARGAAGAACASAWAWVEANVLSDVLTTGALVGLASLELIPILRGLVRSRNAFHKTASDVEAYTLARIEYDARSEEREKEFYKRLEARDAELLLREESLQNAIVEFRMLAEGYNKNLIASEERLANALHHVKTCADKTERMVYLGLSNSCELVKNGTARRIAEVEENEEEA